jgi:hypothetical protein
MTVRIFQIVAVVLAGSAVYFWWMDNFDYAFAGVVLAICSFFLSMRFRLKASNQLIAEQRASESSEQE